MTTRANYTSDGGRHASESAEGSPETTTKPGRSSKSERDKRTYRACLHCRQRKSRCDLYSSGDPGRPPCERCIREQHECVLGSSRRGGRRVKRSASDAAMLPDSQVPSIGSVIRALPVQQPHEDSSSGSEARLPPWTEVDRQSRVLPPLQQDRPIQPQTPRDSNMTVDETVASTDLQNPADALEFLANVAERDSGGTQLPPMQTLIYRRQAHTLSATPVAQQHEGQGYLNHTSSGDVIDFPPLNRGHLTVGMIRTLLLRYEDKYHGFFPLANPLAFDYRNLPAIAANEPHLLAAILTVASKDEKDWWPVHETCSAHMQQLIAELVYSGRGTVEAVEAMLILAEWVPRRPHSTPNVGRGEEDQAAWMYVGTAIRLGYLLGIDRTGFRAESEAQSAELNRKRLAWAACYMSDRQISVRIGKAFWSRGPGPMTALHAQDFPSLQPRLGRQDDFAAIFQANLELTQLFSNAHDVLYATKSRSNQLNFGGEYIKYIDDFRVALRSWHSTWGVFTCSPPLKASLILSYEYLRLYINAFAYQATLNRLVAKMQSASANGEQQPTKSSAYPFADVAATPDARFIYDSIDAAKSLLSTFNSFVDPVATFRFMPLRYYLYVIYSACFLYKARSTGIMGGSGDTTRGGGGGGSMKRMISDTIDRLQQASACANDVGDRYSRLIRLLWRRPPGRASIAEGAGLDIPRPPAAHPLSSGGPTSNPNHEQTADQTMYDASTAQHQHHHHSHHHSGAPPSINTFSWLDLGAIGDFATQNGSISGSMADGSSGVGGGGGGGPLELDRTSSSFDDSNSMTDSFPMFDEQSVMMPPGGLLAQQYGWGGLPPSGIVF